MPPCPTLSSVVKLCEALCLCELSGQLCALTQSHVCRSDSVLQQHRDRQRTHAAGDRTECSGHFLDLRMDVAKHQRSSSCESLSALGPGLKQAIDDRGCLDVQCPDVHHGPS